ncbi:MAG: class I SAM-dependent methyltransferase [Candidatus Wallbacteria bacterium]|nr:class I SAM-dependent methyltransferase [Candidatus Wallbacteria bacterium]
MRTPRDALLGPADAACLLCGGHAPRALEAHARAYHRCPVCDLLFVATEHHPAAERCRARYEKHRNDASDAGYTGFLRLAADELQCRLRPGARILDFGCGPEPVLVGMLLQLGFDATGHDPLFHPELSPAGPYEAVVATEVFEHLQDPAATLGQLAGMLAPRGLLVLLTLLVRPQTVLLDWWYLRDETHVVFGSERTFEWIGARFGFEVEHTDGRRVVVLRKR